MAAKLKTIFEYADNGVEIYPGYEYIKYVVYENGLIEKQNLDRDGKKVQKRKKLNSDLSAVDVITKFYNSNRELIESIPSELDNPDVCDGAIVYIKFFDKEIFGLNILYECLPEHEVYKHINNLINLMDNFFFTINNYPVFNKICKEVGTEFPDNGNFEIEDGELIDFPEEDENLVIPEGATKIREYLYDGHRLLKSIKLPSTLRKIEDGVFRDCKNIKSIELPSSLTYLGSFAFCDCYNLEEIVIPEGVTEIKRDTFCYCKKLKHIKLPANLSKIEESAFCYCESLEDIEIPDGVIQIEDNTFNCCKKLKKVKLPSKITHIGYRAFHYCESLEEIELPDTLKYIGDEAFKGSWHLKKTAIPESVQFIGKSAFYNNSNLNNISVPEGITKIQDETFYGCLRLTNITLPSTLQEIGDYGFYHCINLETLELPKSVSKIGKYAFDDCPKLKTQIDEDVDNDLGDALDYDLGGLYIPTYNFHDKSPTKYVNNKLKKVAINEKNIFIVNEGTVEIGREAFINCKKITNVVFPSSLKIIRAGAFHGCENLTSIEIPDSVIEIGGGAFSSCENLSRIILPKNLKKLCNSMFDDCYSLKEVIIPNSVQFIEDFTFAFCNNLQKVIIPDSVKKIGKNVFRGCDNLREVIFNNCNVYINDKKFCDPVHYSLFAKWLKPENISNNLSFDYDTGGFLTHVIDIFNENNVLNEDWKKAWLNFFQKNESKFFEGCMVSPKLRLFMIRHNFFSIKHLVRLYIYATEHNLSNDISCIIDSIEERYNFKFFRKLLISFMKKQVDYRNEKETRIISRRYDLYE